MGEKKAPLKRMSAQEYFKTLPKRYFITAFSGMAQGLFVTLIAGTILAQIAGWINQIGEGGNYIGYTLLYIQCVPDQGRAHNSMQECHLFTSQ